MSPVAALVGLIIAWAIVVAIGVRRDRRRIDPLTPDQIERARQVATDQEAGR